MRCSRLQDIRFQSVQLCKRADADRFILQGTGIGLSLSLNIVKAHHGQITVESEVGKGSSFIVELQIGNEYFKEDKNITIIENQRKTGIINSPISIENEEESLENLEDFIIQQKKDFDHSSTLLIVEDDDELRKLLIERCV